MHVLARKVLPVPKEIVKMREVPLNYNGNESTFLVTCGASPARVIIETAVSGRELRKWCRIVKGWQVAGSRMVLTDRTGRVSEFKPDASDEILVNPTTRQVEFTKKAGEKG